MVKYRIIEEQKCGIESKELKRLIADVTRCQDWSSWLYSLVSNSLLFTIYGIMWIESSSDIYISLIYLENFVISQNYFMILFYFYSTLFCFQGHIILFLIRIYGLGSPFYQWNHIYEI